MSESGPKHIYAREHKLYCYILDVHYTTILDLNSAKKKKSVLNKSKYLKKKIQKGRNIAIFGHFAKAIVRQNGYKIVDFGNIVLINQLDD